MYPTRPIAPMSLHHLSRAEQHNERIVVATSHPLSANTHRTSENLLAKLNPRDAVLQVRKQPEPFMGPQRSYCHSLALTHPSHQAKRTDQSTVSSRRLSNTKSPWSSRTRSRSGEHLRAWISTSTSSWTTPKLWMRFDGRIWYVAHFYRLQAGKMALAVLNHIDSW